MSARRRLLVVKTSSLGDVVHALPAITDVARLRPEWTIDWVCEEAFADIPRLHAGVDRVIATAIRRWRTSWASAATRHEIATFRRTLRGTRYDAIVDLQGLIKSAAIAVLAHGTTHGYDWRSTREPLASLAYMRRHRVAWGQHAISRNRLLAQAALGTDAALPLSYGLMPVAPTSASAASHATGTNAGGRGDAGTGAMAAANTALSANAAHASRDGVPAIVVLHATSRADKLWPEHRWRALLEHLSGLGFATVLPWGSEDERSRSMRLAAHIAEASVPDRMPPSALAALFRQARAVVGVDTGLVHLAAAVGTPCACVFTATDPSLTGVIGEAAPAVNLGGNGRVPDLAEVIGAIEPWLGVPALVEASR